MRDSDRGAQVRATGRTHAAGLTETAGFVLVADALVALYASATLIVNDTLARAVLPLP